MGVVSLAGVPESWAVSLGEPPFPVLARWLLGLGIAANIAHGLGHGLTGAAVVAWPAVALVGSCVSGWYQTGALADRVGFEGTRSTATAVGPAPARVRKYDLRARDRSPYDLGR